MIERVKGIEKSTLPAPAKNSFPAYSQSIKLTQTRFHRATKENRTEYLEDVDRIRRLQDTHLARVHLLLRLHLNQTDRQSLRHALEWAAVLLISRENQGQWVVEVS
jgi:hypothetical protein